MHVPFRHPKITRGNCRTDVWLDIAISILWPVMWCIFFWKSKDIDSSLFLRELDEKRNTNRTNLAKSITWMKLRFWMHVMTGLISDQMISEIRERLSNISVQAAGLLVNTDPYHRDFYNRFVRVPTGLVQKIKTTPRPLPSDNDPLLSLRLELQSNRSAIWYSIQLLHRISFEHWSALSLHAPIILLCRDRFC